ncbi:ankyrin repeat domain-containing protein [Legionella longbeachae]|uniref:Ankyrin repeat protein n=1 Tax=Legionella longbeachae serogroup 1 (strain NSW150) TaxID=661367 RepID=D3HMV8_LEGLN|nr:ankyrin repeat domain-containing protein [Legionella longbeachae]VEE04311.1 ankyrin repeat protein [Legionella oakridgensis]HBD7397080.1 ankyrin repeat domain-containing protein [Legionella pneumophila]ARB92867.1 ankyrin repeat domain-containing protein [Legionella longbeachae]ARM33993.1 ankyrin repeat domain-containing protein [Legionella longbeachae]EEZ96794.1 ankyrin repeat-containing protein [Legionella longbeachae D-4968]
MSHDVELRDYLSQSEFNLAGVTALIRAGANPNTPNVNGDTLLHLVIYCKAYALIPAVLKLGMDIQKQNKAGLSPLQCLLNNYPIDFEAAAVLIQAGAKVDSEDSFGNNLLQHAVMSNCLGHISLALKLGVNAKKVNHSGQSPLYNLLHQQYIDIEATALLVFAGSGILARGSRLHLPPIKQEHIIDCSEWRVKSKEYLEPEALAVLGKYGNNKERVLNYIQSLPPFMKRELVNQALSKQTPLGKFFAVKRGLFQPEPGSGMWAQLLAMQKELNRQIPISSVRLTPNESFQPPFAPGFEPSAPPASLYNAPIGESSPYTTAVSWPTAPSVYPGFFAQPCTGQSLENTYPMGYPQPEPMK